jgi:hypothetical protein
MTFCNVCSKARPIYACTDTLTVGTVAAVGDYTVVLTEKATGRCTLIEITESSNIAFDMPQLNTNSTYTLSVLDSEQKPVEVTIGEVVVECVDFLVKRAMEGDPVGAQIIVLR